MLCKINPEKVFGDVLIRKQAFLDNINMDLKCRQNWKFCKGDSAYFGEKVEVFSFFVSVKNRSRKVFADVVDKKEAFKDYKNNRLWKTQNKYFSKGVSRSFWSKISDFFNFDIYAK